MGERSLVVDDQSAENLRQRLKNIFKVDQKIAKKLDFSCMKQVEAVCLKEKKFQIEKEKILVINNCLSLEHFIEHITSENLLKCLKASTHCFVIVAEVMKLGMTAFDDVVQRLLCFELIERPLVIQLSVVDEVETKIFFKDFGINKLQIFEQSVVKMDDKFFSSRKLNFLLLLQALHANIGGKFDGRNILTCQIEVSKTTDDFRLIDLAARDDDVLSTRFLNLFFDSNPGIKTLELAVKNASPETVAALLNVPLNESHQKFSELGDLLNIHEVEDLIATAAAQGKVETLKFLITHCSTDGSLILQKASNCAFERKNWKNLLVLADNDAPFPNEINKIYDSTSTDDNLVALRKICDRRKLLHKAIKSNDRDVVEQFIAENPNIKIGFSLENYSSLAAALKIGKKEGNYNMYSLLLYHRFTAQSDIFHDRFYQNLNTDDKREITIACQKYYGRPVDSHVFFIYSKTRLGFKYSKDKEEFYFETIKGYLDKLNQMEEITPILKVIENSQTLMIAFDFENDAVHKIDLLANESTMGICYFR